MNHSVLTLLEPQYLGTSLGTLLKKTKTFFLVVLGSFVEQKPLSPHGLEFSGSYDDGVIFLPRGI